MTVRSQPPVSALAAALVLVPLLAGCGVNFDAQTDQPYTPADGVSNRDGMVDVLNALIVSGTPGSGRLIAGLANNDQNRPDELTGVVGAGNSQGLTITIAGGTTTIPAGGFVQLADDSAANVQVQGDPGQLYAGAFARVTLAFRNADSVTVNVPVLAPGETYQDVQLTPSASPTPTPPSSPTSGPSQPRAGKRPGSPTGSPTASPTGK